MTGLYNSLAGAVGAERALDVTASNVAHASTTGYQARVLTFREALAESEAPSVAPDGVGIDVAPGAIKSTGRELDVAIQGPGHFVVDGPNGKFLTRDGRLNIGTQGQLVNVEGFAVLGQDSAPIVVPQNARVSINSDGQVIVAGRVAGTLQMVQAKRNAVQPYGQNLSVVDPTGIQTAKPTLVPASLESSNFDPVRGMVELIHVTRAYEALTRSIQIHSEIEQRTARDIAGR